MSVALRPEPPQRIVVEAIPEQVTITVWHMRLDCGHRVDMTDIDGRGAPDELACFVCLRRKPLP